MFDRAHATGTRPRFNVPSEQCDITIQVTHKIHTRTGWGTIPNVPLLGIDPRTCGMVGARASHQTIAPPNYKQIVQWGNPQRQCNCVLSSLLEEATQSINKIETC